MALFKQESDTQLLLIYNNVKQKNSNCSHLGDETQEWVLHLHWFSICNGSVMFPLNQELQDEKFNSSSRNSCDPDSFVGRQTLNNVALSFVQVSQSVLCLVLSVSTSWCPVKRKESTLLSSPNKVHCASQSDCLSGLLNGSISVCHWWQTLSRWSSHGPL